MENNIHNELYTKVEKFNTLLVELGSDFSDFKINMNGHTNDAELFDTFHDNSSQVRKGIADTSSKDILETLSEYIEKNKETNDFAENIKTSLKEAGFVVVDKPKQRLEDMKKYLEYLQYGDDGQFIKDTELKYSKKLEKANNILQKAGLSGSVEDLLMSFYNVYWNNSSLNITNEFKTSIKKKFKLSIRSLFCSINQSSEQVTHAICNMKFILSDKFLYQFTLYPFEKELPLHSIGNTLYSQQKNIFYELSKHDIYKKLYQELIDNLSKIDEVKDIKQTLLYIENHRSSYSNDTKDQINNLFSISWKLGLSHLVNHNKKDRSLDATISYYKELKILSKNI